MRPLLLSTLGLLTVACSANVETLLDGGGSITDAGNEEKVCGAAGAVDRYGASLEGCVTHRGSIVIENFLEGLADVGRLHALREIEENFTIALCFDLISLRGLERLERAGSFGISEVPLLSELSPLASLQNVERSLVLGDMGSLISLQGLNGVESIGARLWLTKLAKLESLDGLERLRTVGQLTITDNNSLRSLAGLSRLERVDGQLDIKWNPQLPRSEIDVFLARVSVGGPIFVEGNAP
jgi:hypothetical protein